MLKNVYNPGPWTPSDSSVHSVEFLLFSMCAFGLDLCMQTTFSCMGHSPAIGFGVLNLW